MGSIQLFQLHLTLKNNLYTRKHITYYDIPKIYTDDSR